MGYWPQLADDESADPRDRGYAKWLRDTDKVVLSTTLTEAPWERTRVVNAPTEEVVAELKASGEGHILLNNSASVTRPLLAADLLDRIYLILCPEIAGGGRRLFDDDVPASTWKLAHLETGELGEIAMVYDRARR